MLLSAKDSRWISCHFSCFRPSMTPTLLSWLLAVATVAMTLAASSCGASLARSWALRAANLYWVSMATTFCLVFWDEMRRQRVTLKLNTHQNCFWQQKLYVTLFFCSKLQSYCEDEELKVWVHQEAKQPGKVEHILLFCSFSNELRCKHNP